MVIAEIWKARFEYPYSLRVKKPDNSERSERKVGINGVSHSPPTCSTKPSMLNVTCIIFGGEMF